MRGGIPAQGAIPVAREGLIMPLRFRRFLDLFLVAVFLFFLFRVPFLCFSIFFRVPFRFRSLFSCPLPGVIFPFWFAQGSINQPKKLLRGATLIRTHDGYKNPYTPLFLHTIVGPDYYVPP